MSSEIAISVTAISKCYEIYNAPSDRLRQFVMPRIRRILGRANKNYFKEFWAIKDVSFEVKKGETVGIIGRNGSGKSTLLQMICGTLNPSSGNIQSNGRIAALLELGSGFNPEFTGRENVYMNASVLGLSNEEIDARFNDIIAFADIGDFIDQPIKTFSSGMMVRLAFAVIAHVDADVLIIDEALAVGDSVFVQKCNRFIRRFVEKGTLLFVSHATQSVLELCDRSIWLKQGKIHKDGEAKEVVRHYSAYVHQQINDELTVSVVNKSSESIPKRPNKNLDERRDVLSSSNLKYTIELYDFDFDSSHWGVGGAEITDIAIFNELDEEVTVIDDCGMVLLRVHCRAIQELTSPIVGISIRNQRGVELISENTNLTYLNSSPPKIAQGSSFYADFKFFLPYLPSGEYTVSAAVANGIQENFVQHHRRDDALRFTVLSSHLVHGLFAMPLEACRIVLND